MALNGNALKDQLRSFLARPPLLEDACAVKWSEAMMAYTENTSIGAQVPPLAVEAAGGALRAALVGMAVPNMATDVLEQAFAAFATELEKVSGAAPMAVREKVNFGSVLVGQFGSPDVAAAQLVEVINTWASKQAPMQGGITVGWTYACSLVRQAKPGGSSGCNSRSGKRVATAPEIEPCAHEGDDMGEA